MMPQVIQAESTHHLAHAKAPSKVCVPASKPICFMQFKRNYELAQRPSTAKLSFRLRLPLLLMPSWPSETPIPQRVACGFQSEILGWGAWGGGCGGYSGPKVENCGLCMSVHGNPCTYVCVESFTDIHEHLWTWMSNNEFQY